MLFKFTYEIRTQTGGIIGNVVIEAHDRDDADAKLQRRYPGCTVLDCQVS